MRKLFHSALLSTVDSLIPKMGKFRCQLYALKVSETPVKAIALNDEPLLNREHVAHYLNISRRYCRTLHQKGIIPFFWNKDHYDCKLSDLEKVVELNPTLFKKREIAAQKNPSQPFPFYSKIVKIAPYMPDWAIVDFTFDTWKSKFFIPLEKSKDDEFINTVCKSIIFHRNETKPFPLNPVAFFSKN